MRNSQTIEPISTAEMADCFALHLGEAPSARAMDQRRSVHVSPVVECNVHGCVHLSQGDLGTTLDFGPIRRDCAEPPLTGTLTIPSLDHLFSRTELDWIRAALLIGLDKQGWPFTQGEAA